jgi:hypothetical protein
MRRLLLMFLLALAVAYGQDDKYLTNGDPNGFMWTEMSDLTKVAVVMGMQVGRGVVVAWMLQTQPQCRELVNSDAKWPNLSNGALAKEVDVFYGKDPANLKLPIRTATIYVLMKVSGVSEKDLENYRTFVLRGIGGIDPDRPVTGKETK